MPNSYFRNAKVAATLKQDLGGGVLACISNFRNAKVAATLKRFPRHAYITRPSLFPQRKSCGHIEASLFGIIST